MSNNHQHFEVVVIGGGPGGYPAAIRAAQLGKKVALIEAGDLGGTCLNRGCIPSKTLIANADVLQKVKEAEEFGIHVGEVSFDYSKMVRRKDETVTKIRKSLEGLIKSNQITLIRGYGRLTGPREIKVAGQDNLWIKADKIIIATGSEPRTIPAFPFDGERILNSTDLLNITTLPKRIAIVGGGIIGCEFASLFAAFGVEVAIFELMDRIIPMESSSVSDTLSKAFRKKGIQINTKVMVEGIEKTGKGIKVKMAEGKSWEADIVLVSVGRQLNTTDIGLEIAGVALHDNGLIRVNERMETSVSGIYAVGDIASKWWLAHVASHQGLVAGSNAAGHPMQMHYNAVPSVIFTEPEIGTVGMSLETANASGYDATLGAFPFQALGKSQASMQTEGFAQIVMDKRTHQVLGAQVVGHDAATLIAEMAVAIANELTIESITDTIHAHPTVAEAWLEAALLVNDTPLHLPPKRKLATTESRS